MLTYSRTLAQQRSAGYPSFGNDIEMCRHLTHRYAKSFSVGIRLFPSRVRVATYALYGFVRLPDDIVDEKGLDDTQAHAELSAWVDRWNDCLLRGGDSDEPVLRAMAWAMRNYGIPRSCTDDFFAAMLADTTTKTYQTYEDLCGYMHGSASVVGEMMCHIFQTDNDAAFLYARRLGEAFQMTNFLRDVDADWHQRGRIYIPLADLERFGLNAATIRNREYSEQWRQLMQFEIGRTRELYQEARFGFRYLPEDCRLGVAAAADIYEAILDKIAAVDGNVFQGRVSTSTWEKASLLGRRLLNR
jgi:phytoene synthase